MTPANNRAITALFRVFGEKEAPISSDRTRLTSLGGMNRQEALTLAILIPATAVVGVGEQLTLLCGPLVGCLLAVPAAFLVLQLLPFLLNAKSPSVQWGLWLLLGVSWALHRCQTEGLVGLFASIWIAIGVISLAAKLVLAWQASMNWRGSLGIFWRTLVILIPHAMAIFIGYHFGWPWGLLCAAAVAGFFCSAILNPSSQILGTVTCKTSPPGILITIDDGPDPTDTPLLLDVLDRYQTKAIFFMIGEKVRAYPTLAREVIRRGHEIGNHTLSHPQASFWCAGPWRTRREILQCQQIIEQVTGTAPRWFRAPVGHRNLFTHPVAQALGLHVMAWNRRGFDAVERDPCKVLARILPELTGGDVVLLHEATPIAKDVLTAILTRQQALLNPSHRLCPDGSASSQASTPDSAG